jgi:hypothetical protein
MGVSADTGHRGLRIIGKAAAVRISSVVVLRRAITSIASVLPGVSYSPLAALETFRRASGIGRLASPGKSCQL